MLLFTFAVEKALLPLLLVAVLLSEKTFPPLLLLLFATDDELMLTELLPNVSPLCSIFSAEYTKPLGMKPSWPSLRTIQYLNNNLIRNQVFSI